ncbi:hypothetical protein F5Y07DRAFT_372755 [Xylaria sp. FL0933]|nr:hypothetical protein F5Y07DRAFT_372755 [Xylaria sp. FL0933]
MARPHDLINSKKKVKTGCRTCKARRVKCDEGRPACHRCVSTGRSCEGYGIWGGGTLKCASQTITPARTDTVQYAISSHFGELSAEQETCFKWFRHRTSTKLPLPFITPFWNTLILQACTSESSIFHAILALSSAHQKESLDEDKPIEDCTTLDSQQKFMLQEYGESIRSLQSHLISQDRRSLQVALTTCAIFTFLENLLGRYHTANAHLHSGLRLLAEVYGPVDCLAGEMVTATSRGYVDNWIIEIFVRLHVQAALWGQGLLSLYPRLPVFPITPIPAIFENANQAAQHMDRLILDILHLSERSSGPDDSAVNPTHGIVLNNRRQSLLRELEIWSAAYHATNVQLCEGFAPVDEFYMKVLRGYYIMAVLMLSTCTWPVYEMVYDFYTAGFLELLEQLIVIWKAHVARPAWRINPATADMPRKISHSVGDKGWNPLLYFLAVKCRVHRIRLQAIRLLSQTSHKEGIWDAWLAIIVAKEIMRIEEGDYYQGLDINDKFSMMSMPTEQDLALPPLPECRRLYNTRVGLPEHAMGTLTLEYDQKLDNAIGTVRRKRCYDLKVRHWVDVVDEVPVHLSNLSIQ